MSNACRKMQLSDACWDMACGFFMLCCKLAENTDCPKSEVSALLFNAKRNRIALKEAGWLRNYPSVLP